MIRAGPALAAGPDEVGAVAPNRLIVQQGATDPYRNPKTCCNIVARSAPGVYPPPRWDFTSDLQR